MFTVFGLYRQFPPHNKVKVNFFFFCNSSMLIVEWRVFFGQATDFPLGGPKRQSYAVGQTWASIHGPHISFLWVVHTGFAHRKLISGPPRAKLLSALCGCMQLGPKCKCAENKDVFSV